jgi:predicted DNA binding CopG/RHH family protein
MKKFKEIPIFANEAEEALFWSNNDSTEYLDWTKSEKLRLSNLGPSTTAISVRLPVDMLDRLKIAAHKRDVPYQSLLKIWIDEKLSA